MRIPRAYNEKLKEGVTGLEVCLIEGVPSCSHKKCLLLSLPIPWQIVLPHTRLFFQSRLNHVIISEINLSTTAHIPSVSAQFQIACCECWNRSIFPVLSFIYKSCYHCNSPLKFISVNVTHLVRVQHVQCAHWERCLLSLYMTAVLAWHLVLPEQMGIDPVSGGLVLACQPAACRAASQRCLTENLPCHLDRNNEKKYANTLLLCQFLLG